MIPRSRETEHNGTRRARWLDIFSRHRQTGEREAVIAITRLSRYGQTDTATANHPKTGGREIP